MSDMGPTFVEEEPDYAQAGIYFLISIFHHIHTVLFATIVSTSLLVPYELLWEVVENKKYRIYASYDFDPIEEA